MITRQAFLVVAVSSLALAGCGGHGSSAASSSAASSSREATSPAAAGSSHRPCGLFTVVEETAIMGGDTPNSYKQITGYHGPGCDMFGGPPQKDQGSKISFTWMANEQLYGWTAADKADGYEADDTRVLRGMFGIPVNAKPGTVWHHGLDYGSVLPDGDVLTAQGAVNLATGADASGTAAATQAAMAATVTWLESR